MTFHFEFSGGGEEEEVFEVGLLEINVCSTSFLFESGF